MRSRLTTLFVAWFAAALATAADAANPPWFTAVFDAGWSSFRRDEAAWVEAIGKLKTIGVNTVILQYSIQTTKDARWRYYPSGLGWVDQSYEDRSHTIPRALKAASAAGFRVFIGLYYENDGWWKDDRDPDYLKRNGERAVAVVDELEGLYGSSYTNTIAGYYLPHEIASYPWASPEKRKELIDRILQPVLERVHAKQRKLLTSPLITDNEPPQALGAFWKVLFAEWKPDIVALQDGVGTPWKPTVRTVAPFIEAGADAAKEANVEFWVNMELFEKPGGGAACLRRINRQFDAAKGRANVLAGYDASVLNGDLYKVYGAYLKTGSVPLCP